jgi:hypothetical protein
VAGKNRRLMTSIINRNISNFYILIVLVFFINGFSQSSKNFLIVENPFEVKIFNKYEQNLSFNDTSYFLQYCPIEIVADDTVLSDDYTPAFIGKIENQFFYFLKPEQNIPFSNLFNSYSNYVKNAKSLMDTIQVIQDDKILFYNAKDKNQKERLAIETKLIRVFTKGSRTYVKGLAIPVKYGWCDLRNKNSWIVYKSPKKVLTENITEIESLIKAKLFEVNESLTKLFSHFNQINKKNVPIPYWTFVNQENEFVCTLLNNEIKYEFAESTNILMNELQLTLAHTSYNVVWQSNEILIYKNQSAE